MQNAMETPYIVLRPFSAGGCDWKPKEIFNAALCSARQLRQLLDQRRIAREGEDNRPMSRARAKWLGINPDSTLSTRPSDVRIPRRKIKPDSEWNGKEGHIYFKHTGKRKYRVFEGEVALSGPMKKDEAMAEAARIAEERRAAAEGKAA